MGYQNTYMKALFAQALAARSDKSAIALVDHYYPQSGRIARAAKSLVSTGTTTDAASADLLRNDLRAFLAMDASVSAAAILLGLTPGTTFQPGEVVGQAGFIDLTAGSVAWVQEQGRIPIATGAVAVRPLYLCKLAGIAALTYELFEQAQADMESLISRAIRRAILTAPDSALLGADPAVIGVRPAGCWTA